MLGSYEDTHIDRLDSSWSEAPGLEQPELSIEDKEELTCSGLDKLLSRVYVFLGVLRDVKFATWFDELK